MRAEDLNLIDLLEFKPEQGKILYKGWRMLLVDADALGTLRKELVDTLGIDRARGVFSRFGYKCGYEDAQRLRSLFEWSSDAEWLAAGPMMHCWEGIVQASWEGIEYDRASGSFLMYGNWVNSYEAEQHLKYLEKSDSPTCWTLTGYASGYATAFFGREVLCLETQCAGKGDARCAFKIQPVAEWGDQASQAAEDLKPAELGKELEYLSVELQQKLQIITEQEKAILEKAVKDAELKALQSQVNPHFIFNTLNAIARLALFERAEETERMIYALSDLLRHSLRRIGDLVTLKDEIDHVRDYLMIQEMRFRDRINVEMDIDEGSLDARLPVLSLQPLVENAFIHGLEPSIKEGRLYIKARRESGFVLVEIADNGIGIDAARLRSINEGESVASSKGHITSIGISNVRQRLQHYFGGDCRLHFEGRPGVGTTVTLLIPASPGEPASG
ncbi:MAG: XylR N-terminal domain-containing protein [Dehalococcoidales bacterium]|nr:XylR N-terminal domain-containing protein [Dehalococcoidales bacterium]